MRLRYLALVLALVAVNGCAGQLVSIKEMPLEGEVAGGQDLSRFPEAKVIYVKKSDPIAIDGELDDWQGADWIMLDRKEQFTGEGWRGPEDVSGRLAFAYNGEFLYIGAEVVDDITVWRYEGAGIWEGDSIQVAIDPWLTRIVGTYPEDAVEFGFSGKKGESQVQTWRWNAPKPLEPGPLDAETALSRPSDTVVQYELAIPLEQLGQWRPSLTAQFGASWLINDNDGIERKGYLEWTRGIGAAKDPSKFGILQLEPPPKDEQLPAMIARFHWDRTVTAQGRPLEVQLNTVSQGRKRPAKVIARIDPDQGGIVRALDLPLQPGRRGYAVAFDTTKIDVGRHKIVIELDDGSGYTASTSRSIYIYPPAKYDRY